MQILDCRENNEFEKICISLAEKISRHGIKFDIIVGVATGGKYVGDIVKENLDVSCQYLVIKRQRSSTTVKKNTLYLRKVINFLPNLIQNKLRSIEVFVAELIFERNKNKNKGLPNAKIEVVQDVVVDRCSEVNILVIDDCVDSGRTLVDVMNYLHDRFPHGRIKTAALTITHKNPLVFPDFYVLRRGIIKCPWSLDGRRD